MNERVVIEVELTGYNAEGILDTYEAVKDDLTLSECIEDVMGLDRDDVHVVMIVGPGEKETNDQYFVHPVEGRIVGYRLAEDV